MARLKRLSAHQRHMINVNRNWRAEFKAEIGHCMVCLGELFQRMADGRIVNRLDVDEICPGANRLKSYVTRELCLVTCDYCNCHVTPGMPLAQRLVYKFIHDPEYFSLEAIRQAKDNGRHPRILEFTDVVRAAGEMGFSSGGWVEPENK